MSILIHVYAVYLLFVGTWDLIAGIQSLILARNGGDETGLRGPWHCGFLGVSAIGIAFIAYVICASLYGLILMTLPVFFFFVHLPLVLFGGVICIDTFWLTATVIRIPEISRRAKSLLVLLCIYNLWAEIWNTVQLWKTFTQSREELMEFLNRRDFISSFLSRQTDITSSFVAFKRVLTGLKVPRFKLPDISLPKFDFDFDIDDDSLEGIVKGIIALITLLAAVMSAIIEWVLATWFIIMIIGTVLLVVVLLSVLLSRIKGPQPLKAKEEEVLLEAIEEVLPETKEEEVLPETKEEEFLPETKEEEFLPETKEEEFPREP